MPYGGNNLKSSSDISLESNVTKDDGSLEKTVTGNKGEGLSESIDNTIDKQKEIRHRSRKNVMEVMDGLLY